MKQPSATVGRTPVVSVVTPAYNAARYLPETVDSVLAQTLTDFELILVDDGSTDDTLTVARRLATRDGRVQVVATPNGGPAAARNTALRAARGEFVALLDSDDLILPQYLAKQIAVLTANPDASIVTANAINRGGGANFDGKPYWPQTTGVQRVTACDVIGQEDAVCIFSVFRRRVYHTIGGFNPVFSGNEDYEFWLRAAVAGIVILRNHETLGFYRRHEGSLSSDEPRMIRGVLTVLRHTQTTLDDRSPEAEVLQQQLARFTRELPRAELRASLQRSDAAATSRVLRTLGAERGGGMVAACARLTSCWPQPLLWAYRLRNRMRSRSAA
jgi:GT2 family glycosyltransferase